MLPSLPDHSESGVILTQIGKYLLSLDHDGKGNWYIPTIWDGTEVVYNRKGLV